MICIRAMARCITRMPRQWQAAICGSHDRPDCPDPAHAADSRCSAAHSAAIARAVRRSACRASPREDRSAGSSRAPPPEGARCAPARARRRPRDLPPVPATGAPPAAADGSAWNARSMAGGTSALARMLPIAHTSCAGAALISGLTRAPLNAAVLPAASSTAIWRHCACGVEATSASIVSCAEQPERSRAIPRGPSRGSVRCCVSTAPTPAAQ